MVRNHSNIFLESKTPTNGSEISSLFKTLVHFPRPLPKTKVRANTFNLFRSWITHTFQSQSQMKTRRGLHIRKTEKVRFKIFIDLAKIHLKDINKKKNIENLKMKPQKRKNSMRANSIAPHDFVSIFLVFGSRSNSII